VNYNRSETVTFMRNELYEQIWNTPTTKLAKPFGLSDVALGKICKKHSIPKPPRSYRRGTETTDKFAAETRRTQRKKRISPRMRGGRREERMYTDLFSRNFERLFCVVCDSVVKKGREISNIYLFTTSIGCSCPPSYNSKNFSIHFLAKNCFTALSQISTRLSMAID
jgi:hypothetical protein